MVIVLDGGFEGWIIDGAITGAIIGALLGLTGDSLTNFIDSLINRSRTPTLTEDIPNKEDIEKELREGIESVIPLKKWEREEKERSERCNDMFQEWNNLCRWFNDNWQRKVELDNEDRAIHRDMTEKRERMRVYRKEMEDRGFVRDVAFVLGIGSFLCGLGEVATLGEGASLLGSYGADGLAAHVGVSGYEGGKKAEGEPTWEERQLAELDKIEKAIMEQRKRSLNDILERRNKLKGEYLENRDRLRQLEGLMRRARCEMMPTNCPNIDTPQWMWVHQFGLLDSQTKMGLTRGP